jgi:hypothetical protein
MLPRPTLAQSARAVPWFAAFAWLLGAVAGCENRKAPAEKNLVRPALAAAATPPPPPASEPEPTCGGAGMPECPLQHWMDHQLSGPLSREDYPHLARAFRDLAGVAPLEFSGWKAWAHGGAAAAGRRDHEGVQRACDGCHEAYRERYRRSLRDRPSPMTDPP